MKKTCIILPTYNEADNIGKIIDKICQLNIEGLDILVVDDNSPDGTAKKVESLMSHNPSIQLLKRSDKNGLGKAYVSGFKTAINQDYSYIFEMDADLSHDAKFIPAFLEQMADADLVLGSRYIPGGKIINWNRLRKIISKLGNIYAKLVLRVNYSDLTGGFKCYKREVLINLDLDNLSSIGYNFQIETTYKAHLLGFKVKEIPITFTERVSGKSKFSVKIILESFWKVLHLRILNERNHAKIYN